MKQKLMKILKSKEFWKAAKEVAVAVGALVAVIISLTSCGTTKATISKPAEGTSTTITITTNNPITTTTTPTINLK